jgi:hypothetical protein
MIVAFERCSLLQIAVTEGFVMHDLAIPGHERDRIGCHPFVDEVPAGKSSRRLSRSAEKPGIGGGFGGGEGLGRGLGKERITEYGEQQA